ncbi:hypothetical protein DPMN_165099 [Dreissena polymorpha]|uniref:C2H2-type domain-containing protein n=1 Tax=Dreissena polymorpha TaxID=45954 RepID=A0A9D4IUA8_DREPO|nr:hypothetical protein DPMN_165099 [Dreissena polymorpha]
MMKTQIDKRKSWRCKNCSKKDRKGRLMGHILKHHVVFDRVPFSCNLCSFRCNDKNTLVDHLKNYKRHLGGLCLSWTFRQVEQISAYPQVVPQATVTVTPHH